jgi:hypothetical protein
MLYNRMHPDADLHSSILAGLAYFYLRMVPGGMMRV